MPISLTCSSCSSKLKAPDGAVGRTLKCPKCATPVLVTPPDPQEATAPVSGPGENAPPAAATKIAEPKTTTADLHPPEQEPLPDPSHVESAPVTKGGFGQIEDNTQDDELEDSPDEIVDADDLDDLPEVLPADDEPDAEEIVEGEEVADDTDDDADQDRDGDEEEESEAPSRGRGLLACNHWVIKGSKGGLLQSMINYKLEYKILNAQTKKKVGSARELTKSTDALRFVVGQSVLPSTIEVCNRRGDVLFSVEKDTRFLSFKGINAKILDDDRAIVGRIQGKGLFTQLTQLIVFDCDDREIGNIQVKLRPWQLIFRSRTGKLLGRTKAGGSFISGNASAWRWFPRGSVFILDAMEPIEDDPERKMLLLAAPLVYDLNVYDMLYRRK